MDSFILQSYPNAGTKVAAWIIRKLFPLTPNPVLGRREPMILLAARWTTNISPLRLGAFVVCFVFGIYGIQIESPVRDDLFIECADPLNLLAPLGAAYLSQVMGADEFFVWRSSTRPDFCRTDPASKSSALQKLNNPRVVTAA
jgi:hypothetical protein